MGQRCGDDGAHLFGNGRSHLYMFALRCKAHGEYPDDCAYARDSPGEGCDLH